MPPQRRKTFRCPVSPELQPAVVVAGRRQFPARLIDESRDGYGVVCARNPGLKVAELVTLRTAAGDERLRVVEVGRVADGFRLGLARVHDTRPRDEAGDGETAGAQAIEEAIAATQLFVRGRT